MNLRFAPYAVAGGVSGITFFAYHVLIRNSFGSCDTKLFAAIVVMFVCSTVTAFIASPSQLRPRWSAIINYSLILTMAAITAILPAQPVGDHVSNFQLQQAVRFAAFAAIFFPLLFLAWYWANLACKGNLSAHPDVRITEQQYDQVAENKRNHNLLIWQTPVLALTAQSFLFSIALSSSTSGQNKAISALLALLISIASMQLMAKHRHIERWYSSLLRQFEEGSGGRFGVIDGPPPPSHAWPAGWFANLKSFWVWQLTLFAFLVAAATILCREIFGNGGEDGVVRAIGDWFAAQLHLRCGAG